MFGTYRTILALAVVAHHLIQIPAIGHHAVHGFFILSGYLMTLIMHRSYGYTLRGFGAFCLNRFLRLYPSYWFILALSVAAILYFGEDNAAVYRSFMGVPDTLAGWVQNASLVYASVSPSSVSPRISPPTWALTLELTFYLLIALGISRTAGITKAWLVLGVGYTIATYVLRLPYEWRYSMLFSAGLPFAMGAALFHHQETVIGWFKQLPGWINPVSLLAAFVFNSAICAVATQVQTIAIYEEVGFQVNLLLQFALVTQLLYRGLPGISKKLDKTLGDYSYPIYIAHWQVGFVVAMLIFGEPIRGLHPRGVAAFLVSLPALAAVSWLALTLIDHPIERVRKKIKARANARLTGPEGTIPSP